MSIKVLVTGSNGQLGKTIKELYAKNSLGLDFQFVSKEELDITSEDKVVTFFKNKHFNYCINCAAYTNVEQAEKTPDIAFKVNAEGGKNVAKACKEANTILIHISTDYVFDGEKKEPYIPSDLPNPINEYGKSKLLGERYIQQIMNNYFIVRTSWLYSKKYGHNFYRTILEKAKKEDNLYITDEQTGCPTNTVTLAKYIIKLMKTDNSEFGIYHYCDEKVMTWFDFADQILSENNLKSKTNLVKGGNYVTLAKRPKYTVLTNK